MKDITLPIFESHYGGARVHSLKECPLVSRKTVYGEYGQWEGEETILAEDNEGCLFSHHYSSDVRDSSYHHYYISHKGGIYRLSKDVWIAHLKVLRENLIKQLVEEMTIGESYVFPRWWKWNGYYEITEVTSEGFSGYNIHWGRQFETHLWEDCWES